MLKRYTLYLTAIVNCPTPKPVTELKAFLGIMNHYGKFIYTYICIPFINC